MDETLKGHTPFAGLDGFNDYFQFFSAENAEQSMWINGYEVTYAQPADSEIYRFTIRNNT